jgi:hypothetical protein
MVLAYMQHHLHLIIWIVLFTFIIIFIFEVDIGFCLAAQPWTYIKIGGPSKLPKDFPWPIPNHSSPP